LKEEVYLWDFHPNGDIFNELGVDTKKRIVTFRPPATMAAYHPKYYSLVWDIGNYFARREDVQVILLPRTEEQKEEFIRKGYTNYIVPDKAVDGPSLIYYSDLVVCGGGTMNREAAALGTPAWGIFEGRIGAVDRYLEKNGKLRIINTLSDIEEKPIKKKNTQAVSINTAVFQEVIEKLIFFIEN
jgi:predicted glycosyltransferase